MKKILLCMLVAPIFSAAQVESPSIIKDTLFTTSGFKMVAGTDVKLGTGSLPNGNFKYVAISSTSWANIMDNSMSKEGINRRYNGHLVHIKKFRKEGNKKRGFVYYAVVGGGNIANYDIDVESAIASGEIVIPEEFKSKHLAAPTIGPSSTDELKKLKDLYDSGALTKDEYDSAKKKIISKM